MGASLNAFAYHKPQSIPSLEKLTGSKARQNKAAATETQTLAEMSANVRAWRAVLYPRETLPVGGLTSAAPG